MRKVHVQLVTLLDFPFYYRTVLQRIHVARHAVQVFNYEFFGKKYIGEVLLIIELFGYISITTIFGKNRSRKCCKFHLSAFHNVLKFHILCAPLIVPVHSTVDSTMPMTTLTLDKVKQNVTSS